MGSMGKHICILFVIKQLSLSSWVFSALHNNCCKVSWPGVAGGSVPSSFCSEECPAGMARKYQVRLNLVGPGEKEGFLDPIACSQEGEGCCWNCRPCGEFQVGKKWIWKHWPGFMRMIIFSNSFRGGLCWNGHGLELQLQLIGQRTDSYQLVIDIHKGTELLGRHSVCNLPARLHPKPGEFSWLVDQAKRIPVNSRIHQPPGQVWMPGPTRGVPHPQLDGHHLCPQVNNHHHYQHHHHDNMILTSSNTLLPWAPSFPSG